MYHFEALPLEGAFLITMPRFADERGVFIKPFNDATFQQAGIGFTLHESYFSTSKKDVIRGMHFQLPPHQHSKVVYCPQGEILDVIIDLRKESPTYGQYYAHELSAENHKAYFIPEGFAHGFKALTEDAMTYYLVSSGYHKESDTGILYNSFGFDWGVANPIVSERDLSFIRLEDFDSPFVML
ncbi:dTDP-4-dehydrorhamnose 3,5-epimerase [Chitinophagaceae bacterium IBVUCB1]|nr:dTDP-4-dehydrorhamnose 3,5-epimerase [Chitinophagaceae bacterium IBVUCB1]